MVFIHLKNNYILGKSDWRFPLTAAFELLNIFREAVEIKADRKKKKRKVENKDMNAGRKEGAGGAGREREKESETDQMKGRTRSGGGKERAKTQIRGNQAWGSCAKFTAVIWNPTAMASGWRGRHNRFSFARNSPCLVGVSVIASLHPCSTLPCVSGVLLHSARCTNETCVTRQAAYLHCTWAASLEDTAPGGIISVVEGREKKMWIDRVSRQREGHTLLPAPSEVMSHSGFSLK